MLRSALSFLRIAPVDINSCFPVHISFFSQSVCAGTAQIHLTAPAAALQPLRAHNGIHALRGGTVAGVHTVSFFGPDEELTITHRAASRQIFVNGALHMARILKDKPNGVYDLQALLFQN